MPNGGVDERSRPGIRKPGRENENDGGDEMILNIPEFDESSHTFTVNGKSLPGVTGIINSCLGVNPFWTKEGREAGRALHKAIHYYSEGDLDFDSLDESLKPRLEAYIRFCEEMQWKPTLLEQPLYHPKYQYCGIPDQAQEGRAVIDLKAGAHLPSHALQLAAYANLLPNPLLYERWGVQLQDNGKYRIETYKKQELTSDFSVFISMLNIFSWRKRWPQS
jgi:hypothetical protein